MDRSAWRRPHGFPDLPGGEVHIWRARLDGVCRADVMRGLSAEERARTERFVFDRDRRRFAVARSILRALLGRYLDADPGELRFSYGASGKPALALDVGDLAFNVSHSGALALYAVTRTAQVGIDVERIRDDVDTALIAAGSFATAENEALAQLPEAVRRPAFFACWARKEAYVKAIGAGLGCPTDRFAVTVDPSRRARLLWVDGDADAPARWSIDDVSPAPGYAGALAVAAPQPVVRTWRWDR